MIFLRILFVVFALTWSSSAVQVNMQGSLNLGRQVMDTISHFISRRMPNYRRTMDEGHPDLIVSTVKKADLCHLDMCVGKISELVDEYVIILANTVEHMFNGLINPHSNEAKIDVFDEQEIIAIVLDIKKLLQNANAKITEDTESYVWVRLLKKICAKFQTTALKFVTDRLEGKTEETRYVKKKLTQKLVLATTIIEGKYESKLCAQFNFCEKIHECTKSLNSFLENFKDLPIEKAREFMKNFYESLPEDMFYFTQRETADELQVIFSDMTLSRNMATKDILVSVQKIVESRLKVENHSELSDSYDSQLIYVILSDMDHFYHNKRRVYPFDNFTTRFSEWIRTGGKLNPYIRQVFKEIASKLYYQPPELTSKLINEVKVFLELTVDK